MADRHVTSVANKSYSFAHLEPGIHFLYTTLGIAYDVGFQQGLLELDGGQTYYVDLDSHGNTVRLMRLMSVEEGKAMLESVKSFYLPTLKDQKRAEDRIAKRYSELISPLLGLYHTLVASLATDAARELAAQAERDDAVTSLESAALHYAQSASMYRRVVERKQRKEKRRRWAVVFAPLALDAHARLLSRRLGDMAATTGGSSLSKTERRASIDAYVGVSQTVGRPLEPTYAEPVGDSKGFGELANLSENLSKMVDAVHTCYTGKDEPSFEQCWSDTPETP